MLVFQAAVILWDNGFKKRSLRLNLTMGNPWQEVDGNYYALYHGKIVKSDVRRDDHYDDAHHATKC